MATLRGQTITEQPKRSTWNVNTGGQTVRTFIGTESEIASKALELQNLGYETEITEGPVHTLVATINIDLLGNPGNVEPEPIPQWELIPQPMDQTIWETGRDFVKEMPSEVKRTVEAKLKNPEKEGLPFVPAVYVDDASVLANAIRIYAIKQLGIDGARINGVSLRRSIVVSNYYNPTWSLTNNLKVLPTSTVVSSYNVPNIIAVLMPASSVDNETITVATGVYTTLNFYYGWLEQRPAYQTVGTNRISISQEWIFGRWLVGDNGLYDLVG